jgi:HEPN domain-containing protein
MSQRKPDPHAVNIANAVQQAVRPDTVILHGSRARGDHAPDSDLDLLIISAPGTIRATSSGKAAALYMGENPPVLELDVVSMTLDDFRKFRQAKQHIAGQADHWGIYMSGERLGYGNDYQDDYPEHWPATRQRLENAAEWQKHYNDMVEEDHWNQKLMGFSAQQGVENALRGILSAYNDPTIFRHDLNRIWERYVEHHGDATDPQDVELRQAVQEILDHTTYPDPNSNTGYSNWLVQYATEYRYNRSPRPMDHSQKLELQTLVNNAMDRLTERTHQISGTSEDDVFPDGKPWE